MKKLYHYVHCPFCVRVRMACGFLKTAYQSNVLPYQDEKTPVDLAGKKMLPIFDDGNGWISNESLVIIEHLDEENKLKLKDLKNSSLFFDLEGLLAEMGKHIHSLAMPHWIYTAEFNEESRTYYQNKKELKRGPFKDLIKNKENLIQELTPYLIDLESKFMPYLHSESIDILDIMLAAHIWGLYVVPEFQFSPKIHDYLQTIRRDCNFNYQEDFWK